MKKSINKNLGRHAQQVMGMSFGVIFSIILIIFFIIIAVIVINNFLDAQSCAKIGIFVDSFQTDVKKTWNSQYDSHEFKGLLPTKLDYVCFANLSENNRGENIKIWDAITLYEGKDANLFFYPTGKACEIPYHNIKHIDLKKITKNKNPYCISIQKGKIIINVEKGLNERFVNLG